MAKLKWDSEEFEVPLGERLRDALLSRGRSPHNGKARYVNCRGLGSCGTCAVRVEGEVEPIRLTRMEQWRLRFPPHKPDRGLRLACQVRVAGDVRIDKLAGFWGQGSDSDGR